MKRKRKEPQAEGCPLWVVTFGDAMSLLVAFFVMLVSFADFEEHALQDMAGALKGGFRAVPLPMATATGRIDAEEIDDKNEVVSTNAAIAAVASSQGALREPAGKNIIPSNSSDYYLHLLKSGVAIVIKRNVVFESGTAELSSPSNEVWQLAIELMHTVNSEVRIAVTLPQNVVVRLQDYTTSWGLGIEQALAVQRLLAKSRGGDCGQMSTSVQVVKNMPPGEAMEGTVEIRYVGEQGWKMKGMPRKILRGTWREQGEIEEEQGNVQEG